MGPEGLTLDPAAAAELLACYGLTLWESRTRADGRTRQWPPPRSSAGRSRSRSPRPPCATGPTWAECASTSQTPRTCGRTPSACSPRRRPCCRRPTAVLEVQAMAPHRRRVRGAVRRGPAVRARGVVRAGRRRRRPARRRHLRRAAADRRRRARAWCAACARRPGCSATRARPPPTSRRSRTCSRACRSWPRTCRSCASLELYPVVVAEHGASVLHAAIRLRPAERRTDAPRRALPG